ncbi:hypothetical protein UO65_0592 [Actinokineospora spheciospongiae]|uniref:Peptidase MA-like domain-containing protein n=1 Tax=Actinokineospora spheciospongiae TaxID=909613 RepID=W7IT64_9PSEU|nr:hypothetical protein [Actinokineospora spheciospongiae]EWC64065.1 hypothetical protein UO65_0592 [Actinokineospora spheciospongiae]
MRRERVRGWLAAAVAATALFGVAVVALPEHPADQRGQAGQGRPMGAVQPAAGAADARRADAVAELLGRRADALLRRDQAAFTATLDPAAEPAFLAAQQEYFTNLATVPLDAWSYTVRAEDSLDLGSLTAPAADPAATEQWAPAVELHYALRGIDPTPTDRSLGYLFVRRGEQWFLRSDTALGELGRRTWRGPWDFGPVVVAPAANGLVLAHPGNQAMVDRLVRELDPAVEAVGRVWGDRWPRRVALLLPDSPAEMRALVGPDFPVESVVAVAVADRVDTARRTATGQRVVLSPTGSRALSIASLRVVLRHEITHVAARVDTVDGSPMWLLEGFADYVGYRESGLGLAQGAPDLARSVRAGGPPRALPQDRDFRERDLDLAYQRSWSIARFVADRFGERELVQLYRSLAGAGPVSAGETDELLRGAIGLDRGGLLRAWQDYLREALR